MKYAVVTGSTKGIGKAIAVRLLREGYYVIVNYSKDDDAAELFKNEMKKYEHHFTIIKCALSSHENALAFVAEVKKITCQLDNIILNCGTTDRSAFYDISKNSWDYVMDTNLNVPFYIVQGLGKHIVEGGGLIFVGSVLGIHPHASSLGYAVSKAAIHQMAKELVKVFAEKKVTVNAIAPGFVDTPWQKDKPDEQRKRIENKIAMGRFGYPEEIANLCMTVINTPYINGSVLEINGGYSFR